MKALRNCCDCGTATNDWIRRVPPATRVAGGPPITRILCASCNDAQNGALIHQAQRLTAKNYRLVA